MADLFIAEPLPDDPDLFGLRHNDTGQWLAAYTGAPARWLTEQDAREDALLVSGGAWPPRQSMDLLMRDA